MIKTLKLPNENIVQCYRDKTLSLGKKLGKLKGIKTLVIIIGRAGGPWTSESVFLMNDSELFRAPFFQTNKLLWKKQNRFLTL